MLDSGRGTFERDILTSDKVFAEIKIEVGCFSLITPGFSKAKLSAKQ